MAEGVKHEHTSPLSLRHCHLDSGHGLWCKPHLLGNLLFDLGLAKKVVY